MSESLRLHRKVISLAVQLCGGGAVVVGAGRNAFLGMPEHLYSSSPFHTFGFLPLELEILHNTVVDRVASGLPQGGGVAFRNDLVQSGRTVLEGNLHGVLQAGDRGASDGCLIKTVAFLHEVLYPALH